tara:strand:- start:601 stop:2331 length:1731 start_codon:yes stop_codon:yes gene_type:complete
MSNTITTISNDISYDTLKTELLRGVKNPDDYYLISKRSDGGIFMSVYNDTTGEFDEKLYTNFPTVVLNSDGGIETDTKNLFQSFVYHNEFNGNDEDVIMLFSVFDNRAYYDGFVYNGLDFVYKYGIIINNTNNADNTIIDYDTHFFGTNSIAVNIISETRGTGISIQLDDYFDGTNNVINSNMSQSVIGFINKSDDKKHLLFRISDTNIFIRLNFELFEYNTNLPNYSYYSLDYISSDNSNNYFFALYRDNITNETKIGILSFQRQNNGSITEVSSFLFGNGTITYTRDETLLIKNTIQMNNNLDIKNTNDDGKTIITMMDSTREKINIYEIQFDSNGVSFGNLPSNPDQLDRKPIDGTPTGFVLSETIPTTNNSNSQYSNTSIITTNTRLFDDRPEYLISTAGINTGTAGDDSEVYSLSGNLSCFLKGSKVLTPNGYVKIEDMKKGDEIITGDNRTVKVKCMMYCKTNRLDYLNMIPKGEFGAIEDLYITKNHGILDKKKKELILLMREEKSYDCKIDSDEIELYNIELYDKLRDTLVMNGVIVEGYQASKNAEYGWYKRNKLDEFKKVIEKIVS